MAANLRIIGARELAGDIEQMRDLIPQQEPNTKQLAALMTKYVHVKTGFLRSTIYHKHNIAGATAPYAGYEADRGGEHDFAARAIKAFNLDSYADRITEPF
jgi:hypothetical protein